MLKDEIMQKLSTAGIPYDPAMKKEDLQTIYDKAEADGKFAAQPESTESVEGEQSAAEEKPVEQDTSAPIPPKESDTVEEPSRGGAFTAKNRMKYKGKRYEVGETVNVSENDVARLLEEKVIE